MLTRGTTSNVIDHLLRIGIAIMAMLCVAAPAHAAVFTYQGVLKSAGSPLNGTVDLRFRLYPNSSGTGLPLGNLAVNGVVVTDGLIKVDLDFGANAFNGTDRWLAIEVASPAAGGVGPFTLLSPLQQITFAPMAQFALNASLSGPYANSVSFSNPANAFTGSGAGLTNLNASNLASGTIGPTLLNGTYSNALRLSNAGNEFSGLGAGLTGVNADLLDGLNSTAFLQAVPLPLTLNGSSPSYIIQSANSSTTSGSSGVWGAASADTGFTYGVYATNASTNGRAVNAWATAVTGNTFGVYGRSSSPDGYGVLGSNTSSGYGVYSLGNMGASGTKPFRIDHPDDPANKYLLHYAAESPDVINFYSGKVLLNGAGEAIVELPRYFAKINKDPRYTLTAIGAAMPNLHVAVEIDDGALIAGARAEPGQAAEPCWFRIAGGAPGAKVSWEVKAVRNDRFLQQYGAPVEVDKQSLERGKYQHPDLYDQPTEMGMDHRTVERDEIVNHHESGQPPAANNTPLKRSG